MPAAADRAVVASRARAAVLVVVLSMLAVVLPAPGASAEAVATSSARERTADEAFAEQRLFDGHLLAREDPGAYGSSEAPVGSLVRAQDIAQVARAWSDVMAADGIMRRHPDHTTEVCCWRRIGENVAFASMTHATGQRAAADDADWVAQAWMDSDGHRAELLLPDYREVGIGVTIDAYGTLWATAVFRFDDGTITLAPTTSRFVDVARHLAAIAQPTAIGIVSGRLDGTYGPDAPVTREQTAHFLTAAHGHATGMLPDPSRHWFLDVSAGATFATAINQSAELGPVAGDGHGAYQPQAPLRRGHLALMLTRWLAATYG